MSGSLNIQDDDGQTIYGSDTDPLPLWEPVLVARPQHGQELAASLMKSPLPAQDQSEKTKPAPDASHTGCPLGALTHSLLPMPALSIENAPEAFSFPPPAI